MQSARRLDVLFRLATGALAASPVACDAGMTLPERTIDPASLASFGRNVSLDVCDSNVVSADGGIVSSGTSVYDPLAGLTVNPPVDYVALVDWQEWRRSRPASKQRDVRIRAKNGTPCATATRPAKCEARLDALSPTTGWQIDQYPTPAFTRDLVYTRGNDVGVVTSASGLAAFFGPVMSAKDAALMVMLQGHKLVCGANARPVDGGFELITQTGDTCGAGAGIDQHVVRVTRDGTFTVLRTTRIKDGNPYCMVGRRTEGLRHPGRATGQRGETVGDFLAGMSYLEAASIHAFDRLTRELRAHGAPARLSRAAERARADEVRHARTTACLAARYGRGVEATLIGETPVRDLPAVAVENATAGCVRETFGALVGRVQSSRAADPVVARAMRTIARDELRHAALAWDVAAGADARLTAGDRRRVAVARDEAVQTLRRDVAIELHEDVHVAVGMPRAREAARLVDVVSAELWTS